MILIVPMFVLSVPNFLERTRDPWVFIQSQQKHHGLQLRDVCS